MSNIEINNQLLIQAVQEENLEDVRKLIPVSDPKHNNSLALRWATENGFSECVKLLTPVSDPDVDDSWMLCIAAYHGHFDCVEILIPVSNPKANDSHALRWAVQFGHMGCADLLFPVSEPAAALKRLKYDYPHQPEIWEPLEARMEAERMNTFLYSCIGHITPAKVQRKM